MSDVKWIKITTDIFDDEKILLIESLPESDSIIVIWFKLLCLAGKMNNSGVFVMSEKIPITVPMLATIFRRKEATVSLALDTFVQFGMVEIVDNVITIPNWGKHQNLDKIEEKQKYMREYMRGYRLRQKEKIALPEADIEDESQQEQSRKVYCKANRKANVSSLEEDKEVDIEYIYNSPEPKIDSEPSEANIPLNTGEEYPVYKKDIDEWQKLYPAVDVRQELNKMRGWCLANPSKRKTKRGVKKFINNWLSRQQDRGGTPGFSPGNASGLNGSRGDKKYKVVIDENGFEKFVEDTD